MLHLYCIVPATHTVPRGCTGLHGRRPFVVEGAGLAVWVSEHDDPPAPSTDAVRIHHDVATAAMDTSVTPVPLRFGQSAPDPDAAAQRLSGESAKWQALLRRFAGHAEYGVRVVLPETHAEQDVHPAAVESGTEYMAALARRQAHAADRRTEGDRIAARIAAAVGDVAMETRVEYSATGALLVRVAHLVAWSGTEAYHAGMREVRETSEDAQFVLTGPWPPWSFVE